MRKALLLARHDIIGQYTDRTAVMRTLLFVALPIILVLVNRRAASARGSSDLLILVFGLYAALLPAASAINAAAGSFAGEKEAQTLIPLLAAPIRDVDIVAGKLMATVIPATALSIVSVLAYDLAARAVFDAASVARVLQPMVLYALVALSVFFVLSLSSWVMVLSSRVNTQRSAQQIGGVATAAVFVGVSAIGGVAVQNLDSTLLLVAVGAVLVSDVAALALALRLWDREEAVARL